MVSHRERRALSLLWSHASRQRYTRVLQIQREGDLAVCTICQPQNEHVGTPVRVCSFTNTCWNTNISTHPYIHTHSTTSVRPVMPVERVQAKYVWYFQMILQPTVWYFGTNPLGTFTQTATKANGITHQQPCQISTVCIGSNSPVECMSSWVCMWAKPASERVCVSYFTRREHHNHAALRACVV